MRSEVDRDATASSITPPLLLSLLLEFVVAVVVNKEEEVVVVVEEEEEDWIDALEDRYLAAKSDAYMERWVPSGPLPTVALLAAFSSNLTRF